MCMVWFVHSLHVRGYGEHELLLDSLTFLQFFLHIYEES